MESLQQQEQEFMVDPLDHAPLPVGLAKVGSIGHDTKQTIFLDFF